MSMKLKYENVIGNGDLLHQKVVTRPCDQTREKRATNTLCIATLVPNLLPNSILTQLFACARLEYLDSNQEERKACALRA